MNKTLGHPDAFTKDSLSQNKPTPGSIEPEFLKKMAQVLAHGEKKYSRGNWKNCPKDQLHLYWDALFRHLIDYRCGEECDSETNISHLAHAACNIMFLMYFDSRDDK